ncbi:DNA-binding response regulator, OmpR family, contains REC and winged-helix (wHTH) domain [Microbacterium pygmaeum]|uniref:DNA-binding response regulator, OmpR family, contains REC and winged-helix (WHTH) domain n=1 Tax=Microbacterium pygmaeum TaxID=370764 RepID=A0A1G8AMT4_9MICO|nr:response regulator transcription factor [Microbacterium pygmaeum]SDH22281.1 DNA-binding response regulator, OmpR family, contains REC and winged-helix (wHTH) domain [Microbacterium pygmaeum]
MSTTETTTRPRLLLVEDDPQLGPLMVRVLEEVYDVTLHSDGGVALDAAQDGRFEVMIVDRRLPTVDGISIVETLRRSGVHTPMLILTALGSIQDKVRGLDAGANDYLVKPFEFDELFARLRAIRRVSNGEGPFVRVGEWEFYPDSRAIYSPYDGRTILTDRESELLKLLAVHPDKTFTRDEILRTVFTTGDTPGTVDTYVHYLRRKTDADIITTVRGRGYRLGQL